jgi:hypothetical protein
MDISSSSVNGDCEEYELYASLPKLTPGPFFLHLHLRGALGCRVETPYPWVNV